MNTTSTVLGEPELTRADMIGKPLLWRHAKGEDKIEYNEDNDKLWEILNELAENERILNNKIALLHEEQQQIFMEARYANSPSKPINLNGVMSDTDKSSVVRNLMNTQSFIKPGGKSRRVFRKKTKTTRRRNKKSNRSHHHRRTSHVAKQT
jgi:hypothetical protein